MGIVPVEDIATLNHLQFLNETVKRHHQIDHPFPTAIHTAFVFRLGKLQVMVQVTYLRADSSSVQDQLEHSS